MMRLIGATVVAALGVVGMLIVNGFILAITNGHVDILGSVWRGIFGG